MSLAKDTTFLFEITPKHPTRKVYDHVLYPTGFAYLKKMTVRQAIAAFNTCNQMKAVFEDAYYPVTIENIEDVMKEIEAGTAPTIVESVDAGVHTIASFISSIDRDMVLLGEWTTGELADLKIEDGDIRGVIYWVIGFSEFNPANEREQSGYYLPFAWTENEEYTSPKMRVLNGSNKYVNMDTENLVWLGSTQKEAEVKLIEVTATNADGEEVKFTMRVLHAIFDKDPVSHIQFTNEIGQSTCDCPLCKVNKDNNKETEEENVESGEDTTVDNESYDPGHGEGTLG